MSDKGNGGGDAGQSYVAAQLYKRLIEGSRVLALRGHDDFNQGQISGRLKGADNCIIKTAMTSFAGAGVDDFCEAAVAFDVVLPSVAPPETPLHQAIYQARPDVHAIVHTHHEDFLVIAATRIEIEPISHEGAYFNGDVAWFDQTSQTILDAATATAVAQSLGQRNVVFLCNHGSVVVGKSVREAVLRTLMLERACRVQWKVLATGRPYTTSRPEELEHKRKYIYSDVAMRSYWRSLLGDLLGDDEGGS